MKIVKIKDEKGRSVYVNVGRGNMAKAVVQRSGSLTIQLSGIEGLPGRVIVTGKEAGELQDIFDMYRIDKKGHKKDNSEVEFNLAGDSKIKDYKGIPGLNYFPKLKRYKKEGDGAFLSGDKVKELFSEYNIND